MLKLLPILLALSIGALSQTSSPAATNPASSPPAQTDSNHKDANAASATQDNSGLSGDQVTKPAGSKTATLIGCLSGLDGDGHYVLTSMQYRSGVEVLGPTDLDKAAGQKVKLTGQWLAPSGSETEASEKKQRRFQATSFDLMADKCPPPAETAPISKQKRQQKQKAARQATGNNPQ